MPPGQDLPSLLTSMLLSAGSIMQLSNATFGAPSDHNVVWRLRMVLARSAPSSCARPDLSLPRT